MKNKKWLIDANLLAKDLELLAKHEDSFRKSVILGVVHTIKAQPTVDAAPVVHGRWESTDIIAKKAGYGVRYYRHAECKVNPCRLFECESDYCPNCGAMMDGGHEYD